MFLKIDWSASSAFVCFPAVVCVWRTNDNVCYLGYKSNLNSDACNGRLVSQRQSESNWISRCIRSVVLGVSKSNQPQGGAPPAGSTVREAFATGEAARKAAAASTAARQAAAAGTTGREGVAAGAASSETAAASAAASEVAVSAAAREMAAAGAAASEEASRAALACGETTSSSATKHAEDPTSSSESEDAEQESTGGVLRCRVRGGLSSSSEDE